MKTNKKILIIITMVAMGIFIITFGYCLINRNEIENNNKTAFYVQEFLEETPTSKTVLNEIDKTTQEFLEIDAFNNGFYFSKFNKRYIIDAAWLNKNSIDKNIIKNQYFNEVIMLRLKVLAYQGSIDDFNKLFDSYIYDIENNLHTNVRLISLFINDEKHPVLYNSELFEIIESSIINSYNDCKDITTKFYLLNEIVQFYSYFEECSNEEDLYRKELVELIKNNKALLQESIAR